MIDSVDYFIGVARAVAKKSKDTSTQVGSVIVDEQKRIIATGYNGFVAGCDESKLSWERPDKYLYVIHAELNSLLYAQGNLKNHTLYCTHAPCVNCLKHILQAGVKQVWYEDSSIMKRTSIEENRAIVKLLEATGARVLSSSSLMSYEDEIKYQYKNVEDFLM